MSTKNYNAAIYVRLSKDDGDKAESNSIKGQKELIKDYLKSMPEIQLCSEHVDDGFSGVDFLRPGFMAMMEDIKAGKINCVIVKDFSRFGRNYIEVGKYLENIFPFLGVRFISVNDHYDSANKSSSDDLIMPFKNLINDAYARDISVKIRSQLAVKRKQGEFTGSFAVYGYLKDPKNKNKLIIDEYAAGVVREIFRMKTEGFSQQKICNIFNERGELSPMEYKQFIGLNFKNGFKTNIKALWTPVGITRILKNPIYIGVLEQGKIGTPNHKIKIKTLRPKEEWCIVENAHEPIISKQVFELMTSLLAKDTRIAPSKEIVYVFSGLLFCGVCGNSVIRKTIPRNGKKYIYYICSSKKNGGGCVLAITREDELIDIVLAAIKNHISGVLDLDEMLRYVDTLSAKEQETQKLTVGMTLRNEEVEKYRQLKESVYEDFKDGVLDMDEYRDLTNLYSKRLSDAEIAVNKIRQDIELISGEDGEQEQWIAELKEYRNITELSRRVVVSLIERITIYDKSVIEITFKYKDKFQTTVDMLSASCSAETGLLDHMAKAVV